MTLLPKIKMEIVVSKVPVETVIETAQKGLRTPATSATERYLYDVENAVKVRTARRATTRCSTID